MLLLLKKEKKYRFEISPLPPPLILDIVDIDIDIGIDFGIDFGIGNDLRRRRNKSDGSDNNNDGDNDDMVVMSNIHCQLLPVTTLSTTACTSNLTTRGYRRDENRRQVIFAISGKFLTIGIIRKLLMSRIRIHKP